MADRDWRSLERRYLAGERSLLPALNVARRRVGLTLIRERIVHYLKADFHHAVGNDGWLDPASESRWVYSICGSLRLYARSLHTKKKLCPYTPDKTLVTCKTCLRCLSSLKFREGKPRFHMLVRDLSGNTRTQCGGKRGRSTEDPKEVGCHGCVLVLSGKRRTRGGHGMNARGRRRLRRQSMFVLKYPPSVVPL